MSKASLSTPLLNKGTAFEQQERDQLGLNGLLPVHISSVEEQIKRCYVNFGRLTTPLDKYVYLMNLMDRNERLFYQFVARYTAEMVPYIYTPTVGEASMQFSLLYSQQRGLYISYPLRDRMEELIDNIQQNEVLALVVTDGERILGLGDQGIGGMAIPIGKLALYTLFAGLHPNQTLPVVLDVGTNNAQLLSDELYLGWRHTRIQGSEYDQFVESFVKALKKRYPKALLQWEDFGRGNARRLLERYRKQHLSFNDDIQGTAGVVLAALLSALKIKKEALSQQRIVIMGSGSAGLGIAEMVVRALAAQGISSKEAARNIYLLDRRGLIHFNSPPIEEEQRLFSKSPQDLEGWKTQGGKAISLLEVVANAHPTVLIGVCSQPGIFSREIIEEMARHVERPIVFPLSNPTSKAECTPHELIEWTHAKAIIATGTPFPPVEYLGRAYRTAQCNNVYIFPGIGLGALAAEARQITDEMLFEAAEALASHSPALANPTAPLLPAIEKVREVSREVAIAVAKKAAEQKLSPFSSSEIEKRVDALRWTPSY